MSRNIHPLIGNTSWGLAIRAFQFIFGGLVLGLSAYTLSQFNDWGEVNFAVSVV